MFFVIYLFYGKFSRKFSFWDIKLTYEKISSGKTISIVEKIWNFMFIFYRVVNLFHPKVHKSYIFSERFTIFADPVFRLTFCMNNEH
jgi:hypothetical protein